MVRVKRGNVARKNRNKILSNAKGFRGSHSKLFRIANQQVMKAFKYAYISRKQKKRVFRKLWITRIAAAAYKNNIKYSVLINKLKKAKINLNRKMLSQIAIVDARTFSTIVNLT